MALNTSAHTLLICRSYRPPTETGDFSLEGIPGGRVSVPTVPYTVRLSAFFRIEYSGAGTLAYELRLLVPGAAKSRRIFEERVPNLEPTRTEGFFVAAKPIEGPLPSVGTYRFELWEGGECRTHFTIFLELESQPSLH